MAKQTIGLGTTPNDGTGDNLRVGGDKVNDNFNEIYSALGDGTDLQISTSGASSNQVLQWSTANNRFEPTASAAAGDISVDTTPQLGGDLDVNGNRIVSSSNGDIQLVPNGTGEIKLGALAFPTTAGTNTYVLATDGSAQMYWKQVGSNITLSDGTNTDNYTVGNTLLFSAQSGLTSTVLDDTVRYSIDNTIVATLSDTQTFSNKTYNDPIISGNGTGTGNLRLTGQSYIKQGGVPLASFQSAVTYDGAFAADTTAYKAYFAANGSWNELITGQSSIDALSDVDTTTQAPSSGQALVWNAGSSTFRPTTILNNVSDDTSPSLGGNLSTGSNNISGSGTIDLQGSGNKLKFNFANSGSFPNSTTYEGMFATAVNTNKAFYATTSGWITLLSENDGITTLTDVDTTTNSPSYGQVLVYENVGGVGRWRPNDYTPSVRVSAQFNVTNNGSSDYVFTGDGFPSSQNDPILYLKRAHTYQFVLNASGHPFEIRTASGGSAYSFGVTGNGSSTGTITFTVPMNAPSTLYYYCTTHSGMGSSINLS